MTQEVWTVAYQEGWGQRGHRTMHYWHFSFKPTPEQCVELLQAHVDASANLEWLAPSASGLVSVSLLDIMDAIPKRDPALCDMRSCRKLRLAGEYCDEHHGYYLEWVKAHRVAL